MLHLIVNPRSLKHQASRYQRLLGALKTRDLPFLEHWSQSHDDLTRLSRKALDAGATMILPVGGDGTLSLCAQAFFDGERNLFPDAILLPLPFGTGRDFYRGCIGLEDSQLWAKIGPNLPYAEVSVGCYQSEQKIGYFLNSFSLGISSAITARRNQSGLFATTPLAYPLATLQELRGSHVFSLRIQGKGLDATRETLLFLVCKGPFVGGGMRFLPNLDHTSAEASACWVPALSLPNLIKALPKIYRAGAREVKDVSVIDFTELYLQADRPQLIAEVDGETLVLPSELRLKILPTILRVAKP